MKTKELIAQLEDFLNLAKKHHKLFMANRLRTGPQIQGELRSQEEVLNRKFGSLEPFILKVSTTNFTIQGKPINPWRSAFTFGPSIIKGSSLDIVISDLNRAIGHYSRTDKEEILFEDPNLLFNAVKLHPRVLKVSEKLFKDGHYAQAIFEAFKEVNIAVKESSGRADLDGKPLMDQVFSLKNPLIKLTNLSGQSEKDEQLGFMLLFGGAMIGIRNPKAHSNIKQNNPYKTLQYLSFASLLLMRLDEKV